MTFEELKERDRQRNRVYKQRWRLKRALGNEWEPENVLREYGTCAFCASKGTKNGKALYFV